MVETASALTCEPTSAVLRIAAWTRSGCAWPGEIERAATTVLDDQHVNLWFRPIGPPPAPPHVRTPRTGRALRDTHNDVAIPPEPLTDHSRSIPVLPAGSREGCRRVPFELGKHVLQL